MIDDPKIFDTLGQHPNFFDPVKQINDANGAELFQRSVAMNHLSQVLNQILYLTSMVECPAGLLDPEIVSSSDKSRQPGIGTATTAAATFTTATAAPFKRKTTATSSGDRLHPHHTRRPLPPKFNEGDTGTKAESNGDNNKNNDKEKIQTKKHDTDSDNDDDNPQITKHNNNSNSNSNSNDKLWHIVNTTNSKGVVAVISILSAMSQLVDETPPVPGPRRYGNSACREWHAKLEANIDKLLTQHFIDAKLYTGSSSANYIAEIKHYLLNAFGSKVRLDYGTGHELSFLAFVGALWMSDVLQKMDGIKFLVIFAKYYDLVRKLILQYTLEPAGSHGVWGLDDHFHLSYLIGVSQLVDLKEFEENIAVATTAATKTKSNHSKQPSRIIPSPQSVINREVVDHFKLKNLYFNSIAFIYKVKHGPFWETSPILYDISGVKSWKKILVGLQKMYKVEVLGKFPVVQHFYFGGVFYPWIDATSGKPLPTSIS